jgi:N-acetylneuraminic acid mutarotase
MAGAVLALLVAGCDTSTQPGAGDRRAATAEGLQWTRLPDLPAGGQYGAAAAVMAQRIYLLGGQGPDHPWSRRMRMLDVGETFWIPGFLSPSARAFGSSGVIRAPDGSPELYIVGGATNEGTAAVERFSVARGWEFVAPLPTPRGHGIAVAVALNRIYAIGGSVDGKTPVDTVEVYSRSSGRWNTRPTVAREEQPYPVRGALVAGYEGRIYLFGGMGPSGPLAGTLVYDTDSKKWTPREDMPRPRSYGRAAVLSDRIVLVGGVAADQGKAAVDVYDPGSGSWRTEAAAYPGTNIGSPAVAQGDDAIFVVGDVTGSPGERECWMGRVTRW